MRRPYGVHLENLPAMIAAVEEKPAGSPTHAAEGQSCETTPVPAGVNGSQGGYIPIFRGHR